MYIKEDFKLELPAICDYFKARIFVMVRNHPIACEIDSEFVGQNKPKEYLIFKAMAESSPNCKIIIDYYYDENDVICYNEPLILKDFNPDFNNFVFRFQFQKENNKNLFDMFMVNRVKITDAFKYLNYRRNNSGETKPYTVIANGNAYTVYVTPEIADGFYQAGFKDTIVEI